ncbi:hypothetical protein [Teredinibacter turnerae]|uniref:hypothetical protein n=1 Tax=Teredinibacter turnerae TaxID=2426 RepID=UPI00036FCC99|nr:hypothetical protein [Teredinibacter turnerae]
MIRFSVGPFILLWLAGIVYFPTYVGGMGLHAGQKILYLLYPAFSLILIIVLACKKKLICIDSISILLILLFAIYLFSILSKFLFIDLRLALAHFRYLAYFIVYFCLFNISVNTNLNVYTLNKALIILSISIIVFILAQFIIPDSVKLLGVTNRDAIGRLGFRVGGPIVWSYGLAFVLTPVVSYLLVLNLYKVHISGLLLLLVLLLIILGGQSKAAYLSFILTSLIIIGIIFGSRLVGNKKKFVIAIAFLLFVGGVSMFIASHLESLGNIARFVSALEGDGVDASTQTRLSQLGFIKLSLENNILFGYPEYYLIIENAYGYYLYNYGIIGLISYLLVMLGIWYKSWAICLSVLKEKANISIVFLSIAAVCFATSAFVFSLASSPLDGHKTAYFFWSFYALYFGFFAKKSRGR